MATHRLATLTLVGLVALALTGCSTLGIGDDCAVCEVPAPECAPPVQQPVADCAPPPEACPPSAGRPPSANPGEVWCYVRVPAVMRTVQEQVCIQEATCRQEWVPPETQEVCEQVCVKPEEVRRIPVPARFETVSEQVMTCPAKTEWRRVECEPSNLGAGEQVGECWTLCEIPAVYETRSRQVCVAPETCTEEIIPAVYESQTRTVTVREGFYKTVNVEPVYETRTREEMVAPARWEWRRTSECEIPGVTCPVPGQPSPAPLAPIDEMPPSGELPPADPFAPGR
ncbi:MAG: hypothetical protein ACYTG6_10010 [Planctomycetota bacterium]